MLDVPLLVQRDDRAAFDRAGLDRMNSVTGEIVSRAAAAAAGDAAAAASANSRPPSSRPRPRSPWRRWASPASRSDGARWIDGATLPVDGGLEASIDAEVLGF